MRVKLYIWGLYWFIYFESLCILLHTHTHEVREMVSNTAPVRLMFPVAGQQGAWGHYPPFPWRWGTSFYRGGALILHHQPLYHRHWHHCLLLHMIIWIIHDYSFPQLVTHFISELMSTPIIPTKNHMPFLRNYEYIFIAKTLYNSGALLLQNSTQMSAFIIIVSVI